MRKMRRGAMSVIGMAALAGMLVGCANTPTVPEETSTVAPIETVVETAPELSDEEALQIAVETYEELLALGGELLNSRGESFDKVLAITTENMQENNEASLQEAQENDFTTSGEIPVIKSELQRWDGTRIDAYVCVDLSQSQTYGPDGEPVGPDRNGLTHAFDISVVVTDNGYKVDRSDLWTQSDFCSE